MTGGREAAAGGSRIVVNGEPRQLPRGATLADIVALVCDSPRGVAVAVDRQVVPRSAWEAMVVGEGSHVEVVTAAAGG